MFNRLLVPLDGSRLAESVLPVVRRLAGLVPCTVMLLHVIEKRAPSSIHGDTHLRAAPQAEAYLSTVASGLREGGLTVNTHVHTVPQGDIPRCIAEHATELDQDLIVLCRHGAGGVRRFVFGSNAEQVLTHDATPVMFIHADEGADARKFGPERILVLVDGEPASRPALDMGAHLADLAHAHLYLLSVVPTLSSMNPEQAATGRLAPRATRHILDLAAEQAFESLKLDVEELTTRNIAATGRVERGDVAPALVKVAQEVQADLVIMAARGLAGLSAFWADAVTRKVAGLYDGALLLIHRSGA